MYAILLGKPVAYIANYFLETDSLSNSGGVKYSQKQESGKLLIFMASCPAQLAKFCSVEVLKMAYFGLIHPYFTYGLRLRGSCSKYRIERVFRSQKKAVRILSKLNPRESRKGVFKQVRLLTLPCLYIPEVALYCRLKYELIRGRNVQYGTRVRDNFRVEQHRTAASNTCYHELETD
ncbi:hypothetical protein J6590_039164 [Homalodisca vitripennis]|nr:hypothetical protein J6590_039164 [Homalodisca vitripennis]